MKIVSVPHPALRKIAQPITKLDGQMITMIAELEDTLRNKRNPRGVGLSAPQVDQSWTVFTMFELDGEDESQNIITVINPQIVGHSQQKTFGPNLDKPILEGCLSIPNLYGPVPRFEWIELEYQVIANQQLVAKKARFSAFAARVVQHEYDHLQGVLFTDYIKELGLPLYEDEKGSLTEIPLSVIVD